MVRGFDSVSQMMALRARQSFSTAPPWALRALFGDAELTPIKGQLAFLLPQPEVDYMTIGPRGTYMFPRHDGIVLGGSFERGVDKTDVVLATIARILRDNGAVFGAMRE